MGWYVQRGNTLGGPITEEKLRESIAAGKLLAGDLIATNKDGPWREAGRTEFFPDDDQPATGLLVAGGVVVLAVVIGAGVILSRTGTKTSAATPASPIPQQAPVALPRAAYEVIRRWSLPNGGKGMVIAIPATDVNESGLRALADTLKMDTVTGPMAVVMIFNDAKAAKMYTPPDDLSESDRKLYRKHFIGNYVRNANTGFHELSIQPEGIESPHNATTIKL